MYWETSKHPVAWPGRRPDKRTTPVSSAKNRAVQLCSSSQPPGKALGGVNERGDGQAEVERACLHAHSRFPEMR